TACHRDGSSASALPADARTYEVRGRIVGIAPRQEAIIVEHEEVPGYMPAMTMPFALKAPSLIAGCNVGDGIQFRLVVTQSDSWIDQVHKVPASEFLPVSSKPAATATATRASNRLKEGDRMPEFSLVNQDGKTITRETF